MSSRDRSRDVSQALTEVRTVLSRAETAMESLVGISYIGNMPTVRWFDTPEGPYKRGYAIDGPPTGKTLDPDTEAMYYALERVVHELARWRKAGKGRKR